MSAIILWLAALGVFCIDQLTKQLALACLQGSVNWCRLFDLEVTINKGVSWGLFHGSPAVVQYGLVGAIGFLLVLVSYLLLNTSKPIMRLGYLLILSGGISNFCDRLMYGGVVDFISFAHLTFFQLSFNLADLAVLAGLALVLYEGDCS